jgi:hypothetical protein
MQQHPTMTMVVLILILNLETTMKLHLMMSNMILNL